MPQEEPLTFFEHPILNSPCAYAGRCSELDAEDEAMKSGTAWEVR